MRWGFLFGHMNRVGVGALGDCSSASMDGFDSVIA